MNPPRTDWWVPSWTAVRRDARFGVRADVVSSILGQINADEKPIDAAKHVAVIVAHPDDEAISAGAILRGFPNVTVVHVTDGAPGDEAYARRKGFSSREAYAAARRREVVTALAMVGVPAERIRNLGIVDGEAAWHLEALSHTVMDLMEAVRPDVVLTHPYEGGHSDHDSTAFAVHLAAGILLREGQPAPTILELTSYHNYRGQRRFFDFLPFANVLTRTVRLSDKARASKRQMLDAFASQRACLRIFPIEVERFRQAPRYLFTVPPHDGQLDYERLCKKMTGAEWRANADRALRALRTRTQFRGVG